MARPNCLVVVSWNCNSVLDKILEFKEFINEHSPDIILLQETLLRPKNSLKIPNYIVFRNDFPSPNRFPMRGTAILIKKCFNCYPVNNPPLHCIDAIACNIIFPGNSHMTFVSVYIPHHESTTGIISDLNFLSKLNTNTMLAGDFNAHHQNWNCKSNRPYGVAINDFINNKNLEILSPANPTHFTPYSSSVIDFAIFNGFSCPKNISSLQELSSDHNPILINLSLNMPKFSSAPKFNTNWPNFIKYLNSLPYVHPTINNTDDIDSLSTEITHDIIECHEKASKIVACKDFFKSSIEVSKLIKDKNALRKKWQRTRSDQDKVNLRVAQNKIKATLRRNKNENWRNLLDNANVQDNSIWKLAKRFKSNSNSFPPIKIPNSNDVAYSDEDKANAIAKNLIEQFSLNNLSDPNTETTVKSSLSNLLSSPPPLYDSTILPSDVREHIKTLKNRKSPGISRITNKMIKNLPTKYIFKITILIANILKFSYFPLKWKEAIIVPILKPKKPPDDPSSYRPISLLNCLSKLTEKFIINLLNKHNNENNIIKPEQFGFRTSLSAPHQLYRLIDHIEANKINKQNTVALFLDIQKAYDKVWVDGLLFKLLTLNFPHHLIYLLQSYLSDRSFRIRVKNSLSSPCPQSCGLPQGSILSPFLFNIYINDIPHSPKTKLAQFADDTALYASSKNLKYCTIAITNHMKNITKWCHSWKISLNVDKTQAVPFTNKTMASCNKTKIKINNIEIPWSEDSKYLGVILDRKLTFKKHTLNTRNKFRAARALLYPLISRRSELSPNNKLLIYKSYLRPLLTYACPAWAQAAKSHILILERCQNSTIRQLLDMPYYIPNKAIYKELKIPPLRNVLLKLVQNFHLNLPNIDNEALNTMAACDQTDVKNKKRPKAALSHLAS